MRPGLSYLFFLSLLFIGNYSVTAQKAKFYAQVDTRKIVEGSYLEVSFVLEDGEGRNFKPPSFTDFNVVSGPSRSNSTTIVNGKVNQTMSFGYGLKPKGLGMKKIPPATMVIGGKTMRTQEITIEVVKGSDKALTSDKQIFIKTLLTDSTTYVGQQIILEYKLYTTLDVRTTNFLEEQAFDGFYAEDIRTNRMQYQREIIDGTEYFTKPIRRVVLFPQQTGTYTIEPVNIQLGLAKKGGNRGFFFNSQLIQRNILAEGITIFVNSLPATTEPYSGAVGRYKMTATTPKRSLTTDEAITVTMQVTGNGDSKTVQAPKWELPEGLEMYDPNVIEDEVFTAETGLTHRKTFEYLIVAKKPGKFFLKPTFVYFDTDKEAYATLTRNLGGINVIKGSNSAAVIKDNSELELAGIFETTKLRTPAVSWYDSLGHRLFLLATLLGGLGIFIYSNHLKNSGKLDQDLIRKNKAYEVALTKLQDSKSYMEAGKSKEFHEEMIRALKTYVDDKYDIPGLHIKKTELLDRLKEKALSDSNLETFKVILDRSEMAMYAPGLAPELKDTYDIAVELITELEK